jgi:hypothetical protein
MRKSSSRTHSSRNTSRPTPQKSPRVSQIELGFSTAFQRPRARGEQRATAAPLPALILAPRRRRGVVPATRRLAISPEAFVGPQSDRGTCSLRRSDGLVEAGVTLLATIAFGLGWAAYELDFAFGDSGASSSEYALHAPAVALGVAGVEDAEWTTTNGTAREFTPTDDSSAR